MQVIEEAQEEEKPKTQSPISPLTSLFSQSLPNSESERTAEKQTMNSLLIPTTSLLLPQPLSFFHQSSPLPPRGIHFQHNHHLRLSSSSLQSLTTTTTTTVKCTQPEGTVAVLNFEELAEKDFSFLDIDNFNTPEQQTQKSNRIISAGDIKETSRVLVSLSSESFVDLLVESYPSELLLVVHDSLFVLAGIKEMYDQVKCWQGEIIYVPEKWAPFDVVFLYFFPALPFQLDQVFGAIAQRCVTGARLVISHPQGKEYVQQQRKDHPDVVVSDLPDKMTLEKVAADHSFEISEYVDEPGFYLATLKFCGVGPSTK